MITTHLRVSSEAAPRRIGSLIFPDQLNDDEAADDDQEWIENLESILEVDDEAQQPLQQLPIQQQFEQRTKHSNKVRVWPTYALMISAQPQQQSKLIVLPDDEDDACIEDMENWIGNFDYCMDMIKELHDEVYDVNGNSSWRLMSSHSPSASSTRRIHVYYVNLSSKFCTCMLLISYLYMDTK
ncbi:hypothetical protein Sjap_025946 [Stephania japonica]|uniref:Uncharacterized protein n=1 Tax=Stephania japonica TaxID=461633 RepID=A0AAP0E569_9MAGN